MLRALFYTPEKTEATGEGGAQSSRCYHPDLLYCITAVGNLYRNMLRMAYRSADC